MSVPLKRRSHKKASVKSEAHSSLLSFLTEGKPDTFRPQRGADETHLGSGYQTAVPLPERLKQGICHKMKV